MNALKLFVSFWVGMLLMSSAQGQVMCGAVFHGPGASLSTETTPAHRTPVEVLNFAKNNQALKETLGKWPASRKESLENLLASLEFFDYRHTADLILNNFLKNQRASLDLRYLYDNGEVISGTPFHSFYKARTYLEKSTGDVSIEMMQQTHRWAMEGDIGGLKPEDLGVLRSANLIGKSTLRPEEVHNINQNPYLIFHKGNAEEKTHLAARFWQNLQIWGLGPPKVPLFSLKYSGKIQYPNIATIKRPLLDLIQERDPELYSQILIFHQEAGPHPGEHPQFRPLQSKFIKVLLEHRLEVFYRDKAALGPVQLGVNEKQYIDLVADLQRDLVAIHPFKDGNGRTTRLIMNYLLTKEGLPPARLLEPDVDIQVSPQAWRAQVQQGVFNSAQLRTDIMYRLKNGMTVEHSPALLYPGLKETLSTPADSAQFNAFIKALSEMHPEIRQELKDDKMQTLGRLHELFVEYYRSKTVRLQKAKDGESEARLRLVDPDFVDLFGVNQSYNKELWQNKINRWYSQDLIWRGISSRHQVYTNEQLLSYFQIPSSHLVSNRVLPQAREGTSLLAAIKEDFKKYNQDLISGDLSPLAEDHHTSGPRYKDSYGYSTSRQEGIGKAFAMGAMVIAKFGQHNTPEMQAKLKSRINVGTYRAAKDVDLAQLKYFDPRFEYKYGRQSEVMGIGGADPDAVMIVQRINAEGQVIETFLRNPEKPDEVLLIEGRYVLNEGPLPQERIKHRYSLTPEAVKWLPAWTEKTKAWFHKFLHR